MEDKLSFVTDIMACMCLGIIIDYFAKTSFIFTGIGLVAGIILAVTLKKRRDAKNKDK